MNDYFKPRRTPETKKTPESRPARNAISSAFDQTLNKEPIVSQSTATTQTSPWIVRENGISTEWGADEVIAVDGDSETGRVEFVAVADRDWGPEIVTELWVTPQHGDTIKLGHQPHEWHAALDAMTKVVAALDAAYAEKEA
ncbi:hypothetical protein [Tsukamurella tyrosinosolvens]|uniref:hypothetical protein n=1 Tax=Tsukamurella tyrosinosolvens TaxID=57704 RepID=UPI003463515D